MEEISLLDEKENELFNRKEISIKVKSKISPSRVDAIKFVSERFSADTSLIRIKKIGSKFGSQEFVISANIYKTEEDKKKFSPNFKKDQELQKKLEEPEKPVEEAQKSEISDATKSDSASAENTGQDLVGKEESTEEKSTEVKEEKKE